MLTKAPTTDLRELIRWTQTVTKHEALAVRASRERLLGHRAPSDREGGEADPVALIPAPADGPDELVERREAVARSREALRSLKPAELRALTLLAEGYSYAEIGEITGFSRTKVNRLLAEGRSRFRGLLSSSEDGSRCRELRPLLSAFCDGEASAAEASAVREHLRACAHCRATMRTYRAAPQAAAALAPLLPPVRSLLERARNLFTELTSQVTSPAGVKLAVGCVAVAGGAGLATGVVPAPLEQEPSPPAERVRSLSLPAQQRANAAPPRPGATSSKGRSQAAEAPVKKESSSVETAPAVEEVEYEAPPAPAPAPAPAPVSESPTPASAPANEAPAPVSDGSAAGEFGP